MTRKTKTRDLGERTRMRMSTTLFILFIFKLLVQYSGAVVVFGIVVAAAAGRAVVVVVAAAAAAVHSNHAR
eukprot:scaffold54781_cov19-Tisochrysis_lutea.AAC.1